MTFIKELIKIVVVTAKRFIMLLGCILLLFLTTYSVDILKGATVTPTLSLGKLLTGNFPLIWIVVVIVYTIGVMVNIVLTIKKVILKLREPKQKVIDPNETRAIRAMKWFLTH